MEPTKEKITILEPIEDRVVVERIGAEEVSAGGIIIPESAQETTNQGIVTAVGPGKMLPDGSRAPMTLNEGDRIVFGTYVGSMVEVGKRNLVFMRESEVLARVIDAGRAGE